MMKKDKTQDNMRNNDVKDKNVKEHENKELIKEQKEKHIDELKELQEKAAKYDELWNKYLRVCAEFDNARKRWEKEKSEVVKFANYTLIKELLVIMDELEHAMSAIKKHSQDREIQKGIELTYNNFYNILKKEGLTPIEAKGKKFNPHIHEIVGQKEESNMEEHTVIEEVQKGYTLGDRLLRTAKVIISILPQDLAKKGEKVDIDKNNKSNVSIGGDKDGTRDRD